METKIGDKIHKNLNKFFCQKDFSKFLYFQKSTDVPRSLFLATSGQSVQMTSTVHSRALVETLTLEMASLAASVSWSIK